ncbi:MAG: hypothetical protein IPL51_00320 [Candidatus Competibacteraceae bacterium]|nr:hypothetical protein [Candidatus Competibacteraceae bacterium]
MISLAKLGIILWKLLPSGLIFLCGVGSIFLADLIIARTGDIEDIALWATLKSFMMIASTFALFGINQLLVREPKATPMLIRIGTVNILIVSLILGIVGDYLDFVPTILGGIITIIGFSFSSMAFQWLRSNLRVNEAYIASSAWRILFLIGISILFVNDVATIDMILIGSLIIGGLTATGLLVRDNPTKTLISIHDDIHTIKDIYILGGSYFLAAVSLAIASYGENLVTHQLGTTIDVAQYFRSAVMFLFPGMMLNQYLAAFMGTVVRQEEPRILRILRRYFLIGLLGLVLIWVMMIVGGYILEMLIYGKTHTSLSLAILMALTSCVRLIYVLPSAFVGVVADRHTLFKSSVAYLLSALSLPLFSVIFYSLGVSVITSVALASLLSWILRSLVGIKLIIHRLTITVHSE